METEKPIRLTENLNRLLKKERRSTSSIAKELGINKSTLHNWKNGVLPQSLIALIKVAKYFHMEIPELIFDKNKHQVLHQVSLEEKYEIVIRKIDSKKGKLDD